MVQGGRHIFRHICLLRIVICIFNALLIISFNLIILLLGWIGLR